MRPFKFFFGIALAGIVLVFIARIIIPALLIAAVLTGIFFIVRRIAGFLRRVQWEDAHDPYWIPEYERKQLGPAQMTEEPLVPSYAMHDDWYERARIIKIQ